MRFQVYSRLLAELYSSKNHNEKSIIISIKTPADKSNPAIIKNEQNNIIDILSLEFDDVEDYYQGLSPINNEQAKQIVDFVELYKDIVDLIIVHCDAGVSRSAGICAALAKWLTNNDKHYFDGISYVPNMCCYKKVLNEAMLRSDVK